MSQARTARRRRKQMAMNNAQWSGMGVPRYGRVKDASARIRRQQRERDKALAAGRSYSYGTQ